MNRMPVFPLLLMLLSLHSFAQSSRLKIDHPIDDTRMALRAEIFSFTDQKVSNKSVTLAVVLSLVLPGTGEWYAGARTGTYSFVADASLWLMYSGYTLRGNWLRDDARSFARSFSGATTMKDEEYEVNLGNYRSVEEYNNAKLRNREYDRMYKDPRLAWNWMSDADRLRFRSMRVASDQMYQNARFVVGALVVNRLISAVVAGRAAAKTDVGEHDYFSWRLNATTDTGHQDARGVALRFSTEF
jgi:hypothetical protein